MMTLRNIARQIGMVVMAASTCAAVAQTAPPAPAPAATPAKDPKAEKVAELCRLITKSIATLPKNAGVTDLEAAIVFAISQDASLASEKKADRDRIVDLALTCALGAKPSAALLAAARNVRASYGIGTGAIAAGGNWGPSAGGASAFFGPVIGVGGGSSNYTQVR